jgi:catechol 2,3-dioxygenase-like lactoylglutathione lyase family enzyme
VSRAAFLLGAMVLLPFGSRAELAAPNDRGVALGHWHTIVRDVDAAKRFWMVFGAEPVTIDGTVVMKLPGVLVFLTSGTPSGDSGGSSVNHVGLRVSNGKELKDRLRAAGVKMDPSDPVTGRPGFWKPGLRSWGDVYSADGLKIEILDNVVEGEQGQTQHLAGVADPSSKKDLPPVASDHIHMYLPDKASIEAAQAWYSRLFGAQPFSDTGTGALLPGARLRLDAAPLRADNQQKPLPTKGRALDHIGFEVKNLDAFCRELQASGVRLDQPYSKTRHKGFASAELTDPWGTSIELTEGLNRF